MKTRITRNELKKNFDLIIKVPYCKLQYVLEEREAVYYNTGVYGWNYDVYSFNFGSYKIAICTGYRPIGKEMIDNWNYEFIEEIAKQNKTKGKQVFRQVLFRCVVDWATVTHEVQICKIVKVK